MFYFLPNISFASISVLHARIRAVAGWKGGRSSRAQLTMSHRTLMGFWRVARERCLAGLARLSLVSNKDGASSSYCHRLEYTAVGWAVRLGRHYVCVPHLFLFPQPLSLTPTLIPLSCVLSSSKRGVLCLSGDIVPPTPRL